MEKLNSTMPIQFPINILEKIKELSVNTRNVFLLLLKENIKSDIDLLSLNNINARIARALNLSYTTVQRSINNLKKLNLISE